MLVSALIDMAGESFSYQVFEGVGVVLDLLLGDEFGGVVLCRCLDGEHRRGDRIKSLLG